MKKIKKVLLFLPPAVTVKDRIDINPLPPLGLAYLGAVLEGIGIEVKIVDCLIEGWDKRCDVSAGTIQIGLSDGDIEKIVRDFKPDIVGVNNLFTKQRQQAHKIYAIAKKIEAGTVTVAGGAHPSVMPELVLSDPNVDFVVLGEGERTMVDLVRVIEGSKPVATLDGVGYREKGLIKILPKINFIDDLDSLPFPARHLLSMEKYFGLPSSHGDRRKKRFSPIITSRGCPAHCTFCSAYAVWGRKFRARSPENVLSEIKHIRNTYGIEEIMFEDDNLTLNPQRAGAIFDGMIREKFKIGWDTPNGIAAWTLSEDLIDKMKKSGCTSINFAIESGNQHVLDDIIKKPLNLEKVKPLVKYAQKAGLKVGIFLVIGMPHETKEQIGDSFRFAAQLGIYTPHISIATPYPGSELYDYCVKNKCLRPDFSLDDLYIRSFAIATDEFDSASLQKILSEGQRYLMISYFMNAPFDFIVKCMGKLWQDPRAFFRKIGGLIRRNDWTKIR
jgi:anaerobic magnesium-protoporphyrin IX monomethyl ester cyclase